MNDTAGSAAEDLARSAGAEPAAAKSARKAKLRPLKLLVPYVLRYRARAALALIALLPTVGECHPGVAQRCGERLEPGVEDRTDVRAGDDDDLPGGRRAAEIERAPEGEGLRLDLHHLDPEPLGDLDGAVGRAGVDEHDLRRLERLVADAGQQAPDVLLLVEGADDDRN